MEIRRGKPPEAVERELVVDISRDEALIILTNYIKRKLNTDRIRIEGIDVVVSSEGLKLELVTLRGVEVIPLTWNSANTEEKTTPPVLPPPITPQESDPNSAKQ